MRRASHNVYTFVYTKGEPDMPDALTAAILVAAILGAIALVWTWGKR